MSTLHITRDTCLVVAGGFGIYALLLREKLVTELRNRDQPHNFPLQVPLLLEHAHRAYFGESAQRAKFRFAYVSAVLAATGAALSTILIDFGF